MEEQYRSLLDPPHGEGPGQAMMAIGLAHQMLAAFKWHEFIAAADRWDGFGWVQDPTAFRDSMHSADWQALKALAKAAAAFVAAVGELKEEVRDRVDS